MPALTVLGGGPAGLAVGYFANKRSIPFTIYEGSHRVGGNAYTFRHGDFLFDSGAHRLHGKNPYIIEEMKRLLGDDLKQVDIPSQIYDRGTFIDFPLSPLNLILRVDTITLLKASFEIIRSRLRRSRPADTFEEHAVNKYGQTLAERFLLNYSEKLWGLPCSQLSPAIAGQRIKGLDLRTFLTEALLGKRAKTAHLDGSFYYPTHGIGMISEHIAKECGHENIHTKAKVTRIIHHDNCIEAIELNGGKLVEVEEVISTLSLPLLIRLLDPQPSDGMVELARRLRHRNVILVAFFLDTPSVTPCGSLYFPDKNLPFTRVYEPRNRSAAMSPPGKTSLVAEIPCSDDDAVWSLDDDALIASIRSSLAEVGLIRPSEILDVVVERMGHAYGVIGTETVPAREQLLTYMNRFSNLTVFGRNAEFNYSSIHDLLQAGKDIVEAM